jgi:hypothetical protein
VDAPHYDFMLELKPGAPLKTWRLPRWPLDTFYHEAVAIDDHRNAFLTYEGPLSGNRGEVRRVEGGAGVIRTRTPVSYTIKLVDGSELLLLRNIRRGQDSKARRAWRACTIPAK